MGNGLRTQVVEVLIETGGPNELVTAIAPDMVLGQALDGAPQPQAAAKKVPAVQGPVQAGADDAGRHESARPPHSPWPTRPRSSRLPVRTRALSTQGRLRIAARKHGPAVPRDPQPGLPAASPQPRSPVPERLPGRCPSACQGRCPSGACSEASRRSAGSGARTPRCGQGRARSHPRAAPAASSLERRQGTCAALPRSAGSRAGMRPDSLRARPGRTAPTAALATTRSAATPDRGSGGHHNRGGHGHHGHRR